MKAATNTQYGPPSVLSTQEMPRPTVGEREVLVEVHASVVTQGDRRMRAADFPGMSALFGRLLLGLRSPRHAVGGTMFAGRIVEVGSAVTRFAVGDEVFGNVMHGAYAEYLAVAEDAAIARMPANASFAEAAAIPYGAGTALTFLREMAKVEPGERVLVVGASGGVGRMAVQVAKYLGAEVTGVCSRDEDRVRELGADEVINYQHADFTESGQRWDVILDTTEGDHFRSFRRALTSKGRYLSLYVTARLLWEMALTSMRGGQRALAGVAQPTTAQLDELRELVERGAIHAVIAERFPLARIADAHAVLEAGRPAGSVVIELVEPSPAASLRVA